MSEFQQLQEEREHEALTVLVKVAYGTAGQREAEMLAAQLGLYKQLERELNERV